MLIYNFYIKESDKVKIFRNNKGFTLIELLAVLVILTTIMSIALPSISSSLERSKVKQDDARKKVLESYGELYVTAHKNLIYNHLHESTPAAEKCKIYLSSLGATSDELKDSNGNPFDSNACIELTWSSATYDFKYNDNCSSITLEC